MRVRAVWGIYGIYDMAYLILQFGVGLGLLLVLTQVFVRQAISLASAVRLSPFVIGTTIVAVGTSMPELAVSTVSGISGDTGLAWGNIVGSNVINVLLVLAVGILMGGLRIGTTKTQKNIWVLMGSAAVFMLVQIVGLSGVGAGLILLGLATAVTVEEVMWGVNGRKHEDAKKFKTKKPALFGMGEKVKLVGTLAGIVVGGIMVVRAVEGIALATGYSTTVLGLSLTALATSLPELLATIVGQKEHDAGVTNGDIVGSNIYNLLLVGGVVSLLSGPGELMVREMVWLGGATGLFGLILHTYRGRVVPRWVGGGLLGLLGVYLVMLG